MCSCSQEPVVSWNAWQNTPPTNPLDLLANANISGNQGEFTRIAPPTVAMAPLALTFPSEPTCFALGTDNQLSVANAAQWNFSHLTANLSVNLAPSLRKVLFLRGGTEWEMKIILDFGGLSISDVYLTYRDNYGTRGDAQGTIPVISWAPVMTGVQTLAVTLNARSGRTNMVIGGLNGSTPVQFEMEWIIVP